MNKKGVSLMISYVLLITIAIIMSIIIFSFLRTVANVEPVIDCKDGTSIIVEDYTCNKNGGTITLHLRNNGRFSVQGFIPTFGGNVQREADMKLVFNSQDSLLNIDPDDEDSLPLDPPRFFGDLLPGDTVDVEFTNKEKKDDGRTPVVDFNFLRKLKIQPYIIDEETGLRIACANKINKQDLVDCEIKA